LNPAPLRERRKRGLNGGFELATVGQRNSGKHLARGRIENVVSFGRSQASRSSDKIETLRLYCCKHDRSLAHLQILRLTFKLTAILFSKATGPDIVGS